MNENESEISPEVPDPASTSTYRLFTSPGWRVFGGFLTTILANAAVLLLIGVMSPKEAFTALIAFAGLGLIQWIWILPAVLIAKRRGHENLQKGMLIAASLISLLNAACWGLVAMK